MTAYEQRSYPGAAADTLLNADLASNGLTFSVTPGTGTNYPDGSSGPFFIAVDYDTSKAEKVRCVSRINDTFTIPTTSDRGVDGTTAQAHTSGAKVRAVWTATDAQEANRAAANTVGKITAKGDMLAGTGANSLARVPVGADGAPLIGDSGQATGVRFDNAPCSTYTPTFTNITAGGGSFAYKARGKELFIRGYFTGGTYTADGLIAVSLPGVIAVVGAAQVVPGFGVGMWAVNSGGSTVVAQTPNTAGTPLAGCYYTGLIEIA